MVETMTHIVLIVDDDPDDLELTTLAVEASDRHADVKAVTSGKAALAYLGGSEGLPDIILLDLKMPGMTGIDTLREIRSDARLKNIPVIIVTSSCLEADRKAALDAGADGFMHKSLGMAQFRSSINSVLEQYLKK